MYSVASHLPLQIFINKTEGLETIISNPNIRIASLESCPSLLETGAIRRGTYYMVIVLLPLVENAKPYCIGMYCISEGSDSEILLSVHRQILKSAQESELSHSREMATALYDIFSGIYTCVRDNILSLQS